MYITNRPVIAKIAEDAGVDRIFIDMEYIGKDKRQGGMDTVQSHHTIEDVKSIRAAVDRAEILVRCNPIHDATDEYVSSKKEIDAIVDAGADIIMLPYFKHIEEVKRFFEYVDGRVQTCLLLETPEAVNIVDDILELQELKEIHIGLNDLSLAWGMKFMFEPLSSGVVENLCQKFREKGIHYGFGGVAALGQGDLPAEKILIEHYRLGSSMVILSRSFCHPDNCNHSNGIKEYFDIEVQKIRDFEKQISNISSGMLLRNKKDINDIIKGIVEKR